MFVSHWREVAINQDRVPLDVDVPRLLQYERMGCLGIVTARDGKRIVGYVVVLMGPHLHHASTKWGQFDGFWLEPGWRTGLVGYRLLQNAVRMAKEKGIQVLTVPVKTNFANGRVMKLFERLGFVAEDVLYSKVL
jgi:GNAT superfamily N-acetyltransferase